MDDLVAGGPVRVATNWFVSLAALPSSGHREDPKTQIFLLGEMKTKADNIAKQIPPGIHPRPLNSSWPVAWHWPII